MTDNLKGYYAGFISRLIAFSIDIAIIVVTLILIGWLLETMSNIFRFGILESISTAFQILITGVAVLLFSAGYYIFFWTLIGKTPGKINLLPPEKYKDIHKAKEALKVLKSCYFDDLLLGDGEPIQGGAKKLLEAFFND